MTSTELFARPWEQPELTHLNRLPTRATLFPYETAAQARSLDPSKSPWYKSLNGSWKFRLVESPESAPSNFFQAGASEKLYKPIAVPGKLFLKDHLNTTSSPTTIAKKAAPSTSAAVRIMFARRSLIASG